MLHAPSYLGAGIGGCTAREEDAGFVRNNGRETEECAMDRLSWGEERRIRYAQPPCSRGRESSWVHRFSLSSEGAGRGGRSEEHTSELQSLAYLVCRLLLEKKKKTQYIISSGSMRTW